MPDAQLYTREAAQILAADVKAKLAGAKLRLFKEGLTLSVNTTRQNLLDAECDFDGYTAGGYTLTAFTGPLIDTGGGYVITSPLVNVAYGPAGDPAVPNSVGGWWIEATVDTVTTVRVAGSFDPARILGAVGDGWPFVAQLVYGRVASS